MHKDSGKKTSTAGATNPDRHADGSIASAHDGTDTHFAKLQAALARHGTTLNGRGTAGVRKARHTGYREVAGPLPPLGDAGEFLVQLGRGGSA